MTMEMSAQFSSEEIKQKKYKKVYEYYQYVCQNTGISVKMIPIEEYMEKVSENQVDELIRYFRL